MSPAKGSILARFWLGGLGNSDLECVARGTADTIRPMTRFNLKVCKAFVMLLLVAGLDDRAVAAAVSDLYVASIPVKDQSEALRKRALGQGLSEVFVKLTGSRTVLANPALRDTISRAQDYMLEYGYVGGAPVSDQSGMAADSTAGVGSDILEIRFAAAPIDALLRQFGLPIWPADRPEILVWLVASTAQGFQLVDLNENATLAASTEAALKRRGLPFEIPLYDLQDQMAVAPQQDWALAEEQLSRASQRYGVGRWLVLQIADTGTDQVDGGQVRGSWVLSGESVANRLSGNVSATSLPELVNNSIDQAVDQFAVPLTYRAGQLGEAIHLVVGNVDSFRVFTAVTAMFDGLEVVDSTQVVSVEGDQLYIDVIAESDPEILIRALEKNSQMARVVDVADGSDMSGQTPYRFQWLSVGQR